MKQVLTITFILLCSFSYSQDWREDTVSLHGKVKSIRYQSTLYFGEDEEDWRKKDNLYEYNENGFLIKEDLSNSLIGANYNSTYRIYNKENTLCMEEYFLFRKDTSSRHIFFYDEAGKTTGETYYSNGRHWSNVYCSYENDLLTECFTVLQRSKDTIRNVFEYDENFRKIRESYTSSSNVIIQSWNYDERGNVIQEKSELLKAPPTRIFTIEQDGTRTKEVMDSNPDDNRNYQIEYAYNDLNQKTGEVKSHLDGRIQYDLTYEYNQNGDVISESYLNLKKENGERSKIRIVYEYDSYLNWIKKRSYYEEQLEQSETRTIEYY